MMLPILLLVWLENNFFYFVIVGIGLSLINETINLSKKSKLNIKINFDEDAVDNYPLEDGENFIYLIVNEEITAVWRQNNY